MTPYGEMWYDLMVKARAFFVTDGEIAEHRRGPKNAGAPHITPTVWAQYTHPSLLCPFVFLTVKQSKGALLEGSVEPHCGETEGVATDRWRKKTPSVICFANATSLVRGRLSVL